MKKINEKGFILAETLIVSVFLMIIFAMIYSNFYPLIGEYEKRENYDDVDGKYTAYWIKKMVESSEYKFTDADRNMLNKLGYGDKVVIEDVNGDSPFNRPALYFDVIPSKKSENDNAEQPEDNN